MPIPPQQLDSNYKPVTNDVYDASGKQFVATRGGSVNTSSDGTTYGAMAVQLATTNYALAAGTGTTAITVKNTAGYLHAFVVTTTATAALTFYDNASAASGTILYVTSSTIAAGTIIVLNMPFANGLTVSQASGTMAATLALH